jgi:hypothetical protein
MMKTTISLLTIASLVVSPSTLVLARQTATPARGAATTAAAADQPVDGGWPRAYLTPTGAQMLLYQPQISTWPNQTRMTAYSAVSYQTKGAKAPSLGTVKIEAQTKVAVPERLVSFSQLTISEANFSTVPKEQLRGIVDEITNAIPQHERIIALDRVLASIDASQITPRNVPDVKADPPPVFFNTKPSVLINLDGNPIWSPIAANDLRFAVNTNWDLFEHGPTKAYFLRVNDSWMTAAAVEGPWTPAAKLPPSFSKLPADENWKAVKSAVPGKTLTAAQAPVVFVSTTPAEMILLRGEPVYEAVPGTSLMWVNNTESDVFRLGQTGTVYFLVSGRWFSAPAFKGPWTFATLTLPDDFKSIPLEHPRSRVLASVPGTSQAVDAVLLAQVPQTARVNKKTLKAPEVAYAGEPQFVTDTKTTPPVERAVNTDKDILKVGDLYYMCFQGVWFASKAPEGPWEVTASVPKQIYEIPVSSPAYNVTYVTVEDDDDDEWVVFAAAAAYTGVMVAWGCAVWGTGYYYPPYYYGGMYPAYYPRYPTYGYGASYNPWTGAYTRGASVHGPYGGAGMAARYNPRTGTYSRAAGAYGPYGATGVAQAYNPRTGTYAGTRQGSNAYGSWGSTSVQRGDQWAQTARVTNNRGTTTRVTQGSGGGTTVSRSGAAGRTTIGQSGSGDIYAGHDGNVYRKGEDGGWQKYENGGWGDANTPTPQQRDAAKNAGAEARDRAGSSGTSPSAGQTDRNPTAGQLDRDSSARDRGSERTYDAGRARSGSGSGGYSGSYRPSGGYGGGGRSRPSGGGRRR